MQSYDSDAHTIAYVIRCHVYLTISPEGVRKRLGLTEQQQQRCMNFILNPRTSNDYIQRELPAVIRKSQILMIQIIDSSSGRGLYA